MLIEGAILGLMRLNFLSVVVVPMRQGFSKSQGSYIGAACNVQSNGEVQAEDVKAVMDYVATQAWSDKDHVVIVGQSHGGWTTLAFGTMNYPGVRALINFAGGLRQESCAGWEHGLAKGAAHYAKTTRTPSLWFYGENDSYFSTSTYQAMFDNYIAAGGQARLVAFGKFGSDAHSMFGARAGARIWQPEVTAFLSSVGMPSEPKDLYAKYGTVSLTDIPPGQCLVFQRCSRHHPVFIRGRVMFAVFEHDFREVRSQSGNR